MKFIFFLKPRHKKKSSSIKKQVRFQNLRRSNSDSPESLRRRSMKLISCASGFKDFIRSRKGKKVEEEEEIVAKNTIDLDSIQYAYNPIGSLNMDEDLMCFNDSIREHVHFPTPRTPSMRVSMWEDAPSDSVEEACRSFDGYLMKMICEDGKLKDLLDLEEFVKCWNRLSNPAYIRMVHGFYVNICRDMFQLQSEEDGNDDKNHGDNDDNNDDDENQDYDDVDYDLDIRSCPGAIYI